MDQNLTISTRPATVASAEPAANLPHFTAQITRIGNRPLLTTRAAPATPNVICAASWAPVVTARPVAARNPPDRPLFTPLPPPPAAEITETIRGADDYQQQIPALCSRLLARDDRLASAFRGDLELIQRTFSQRQPVAIDPQLVADLGAFNRDITAMQAISHGEQTLDYLQTLAQRLRAISEGNRADISPQQKARAWQLCSDVENKQAQLSRALTIREIPQMRASIGRMIMRDLFDEPPASEIDCTGMERTSARLAAEISQLLPERGAPAGEAIRQLTTLKQAWMAARQTASARQATRLSARRWLQLLDSQRDARAALMRSLGEQLSGYRMITTLAPAAAQPPLLPALLHCFTFCTPFSAEIRRYLQDLLSEAQVYRAAARCQTLLDDADFFRNLSLRLSQLNQERLMTRKKQQAWAQLAAALGNFTISNRYHLAEEYARKQQQDMQRAAQWQTHYASYIHERQQRGDELALARQQLLEWQCQEDHWLKQQVEIICQIEGERKSRIVTLKENGPVNCHITRDKKVTAVAAPFVVQVARHRLLQARKAGDYAVQNLLRARIGVIRASTSASRSVAYQQAPRRAGHVLRKITVSELNRQIKIIGFGEAGSGLPDQIQVFDVHQALQRQWRKYAQNPVLLPDEAQRSDLPPLPLCAAAPPATVSGAEVMLTQLNQAIHYAHHINTLLHSPPADTTLPGSRLQDISLFYLNKREGDADPQQQSKTRRTSDVAAGEAAPCQSITDFINHHCRVWQTMTAEARQASGGAHQYAAHHYLNADSWRRLADDHGLTAAGEERLTASQDNQHAGDYLFHLQKWDNLLQEERDAWGSPQNYARYYGLTLTTWFNMVNAGGLKQKGIDRLASTATARLSDYSEHLLNWDEMSSSDKKAVGGSRGYADLYQLNRLSWQNLATNESTTSRGLIRLIAATSARGEDYEYHGQLWHNMTQAQRDEAAGAEGYGISNQLRATIWSRLADNGGLTAEGLTVLTASNSGKIDYSYHRQQWLAMTAQQQAEMGGLNGYAEKHGLMRRIWAVLAGSNQPVAAGAIYRPMSGPKIDYTWHCRIWDSMTQQQRNQTGLTGYAQANDLLPERWLNLAHKSGLTRSGRKKLLASTYDARVDYTLHCQIWHEMPQQVKKRVGGARQYGRINGLNLDYWTSLANNSGLTRLGESRLIMPDNNRKNYDLHLERWLNKPAEERNAPDAVYLYALVNRLNILYWKRLANPAGLSKEGQTLLEKRKQKRAAVMRAMAPDYLPPAALTGAPETAQTAPAAVVAAPERVEPRTAPLSFHNHLQRWKDMSYDERKAWGGARIYGLRHGLNPDYWIKMAISRGLSETGEAMLALPFVNRQDIIRHLQIWDEMSPEARRKRGVAGYALDNNLHPGTFASLANLAGLKRLGQGKLLDFNRRQAAQGEITDELKPQLKPNYTWHCHAWNNMTRQQREAIGVWNYATHYNLTISTWLGLASDDGLTISGQKKLRNPQAKYTAHLYSWHQMSPTARIQIGGAAGYAREYKLNENIWLKLAHNDGVSRLGMERLQPITPYKADLAWHCQQWHRMTAAQRDEAGGAISYALTHGVKLNSWSKLADDGGLTVEGKVKLLTATRGVPDYGAHLQLWSEMSQQERNNCGGPRQYAEDNLISTAYWLSLTHPGGLKNKGARLLERHRLLSRLKMNSGGKPAPQTSPATEIKSETLTASQPQRRGITLITLDDQGATLHTEPTENPLLRDLSGIHNHYPILRDPDNPQKSVTLQAEGKPASEMTVSCWGELNRVFAAMSTRQANEAKTRLRDHFRWTVENETALHLTANNRMVIAPTYHEVNGEIISLGNGVFNGSDAAIPALTLLGPYAGIYHDSEESLRRERKKMGALRTSTYLFGTRAWGRTVSALSSSNITKNINTGQLGNHPPIANNNVAAVRFGKNITMFVTTREVKPGEEYFIDYGDFYESPPQPAAGVKPEPTIAPAEVTFSARDIEDMANLMLRAPGAWHSELGEQAPLLVMNAAQLPDNLVLSINHSNVTHIYRRGAEEQFIQGPYHSRPEELHIALRYSAEIGHYDVELVPGNIIPIKPDGDCLYQAISHALRQRGVGGFSFQRLRNLAAGAFLADSARYLAMVDVEKLKMELSALRLPFKRRIFTDLSDLPP
ncbi:hypothetical protein [Pantoea sp. B65]|uniref:hypothetical protein n=1 Tax=Pantoea sp. B65 TaxID=2813359 RepID=UPI0039B56B8A